MLIDFEPDDVEITWKIDDPALPFGFEFIKNARFTEVNFGRQDNSEIQFKVAGEELNRGGFRICSGCGHVQKRNKTTHLRTCKFHDGPVVKDGIEDDGIVQCLYMYRQFHSEGLRVLLPKVSIGDTESQIHSFVAALQLGLKRRFGGRVDHLRVGYQSEPIPNSEQRLHFIFLYD